MGQGRRRRFGTVGVFDAAGNVYVSDGAWNGYAFTVRKVTPDGKVTTLPFPGSGRAPIEAMWVDGTTLWYLDDHQLRGVPLP